MTVTASTRVTSGLPLVAVVGRPNVGKSSLVNRILGRREAIVEETPGVTRDRQSFVADWDGRSFELVDTGGLEPGAEGLEARVADQAQVALEAADLVLFVVDATTGPQQDDHLVAEMLRRADKPVVVIANKVDDPSDEPAAAIFYRLGLGDPVPVSALHGRGSGDMLAVLVDRLPETPATGGDPAWCSIAIVGRPNVGKSSLLNALVGEERAIVDPTPGTTRDPVDSLVRLDDDRIVRIVDTAGMRRRVRVDDPLEYFSLLRSRRTLARVDAAVLVVDASEGVVGPDQRLAEEIMEEGRACVVALNKWDLVTAEGPDRDRMERAIDRRLRFVPWATKVRTSALTGRSIQRVLPAVAAAVESHRTRMPTPAVNRVLRDAQAEKPHPRTGGRAVRILYGLQAAVAPPTFVLFANHRLETSYLRFLERKLRAAGSFDGSPIHTRVKLKARREVES